MTCATFVQALLNPQLPPPEGLTSWNRSDISMRFAVYRNNVMVSLIDALADTFRVTRALVGDEFFRAMARVWIPDHVPTSPVLMHYGESFPDFIATFSPAAELPYLSDVARLEWSYVQAFHAADATILPTQEIAAAIKNPERLSKLCLVLHPSVVTQSSHYAIVSLWAAHQTCEVTELPDPYQPESVLISRPGLDVHMIRIDTGTHALIHKLQTGVTLDDAVAQAFRIQSNFDMTQALALLIREQAIHSLHFQD